MWVNATYQGYFDDDTAVAIASKLQGEPFDINHWRSPQYTTTAIIKNMGDEIAQYVSSSNKNYDEIKQLANQGIEDAQDALAKAQQGVDDAAEALGLANNAYDLANDARIASSENTTVIQQNKDSIAALTNKINFDSEGNVVNIAKGDLVLTADFNTLLNKKITFDNDGNVENIKTAGLVTTSEFAQLFAEQADENDYVKRAEISTFITEDEAGKLISNATIQADNINFQGKTMINGNFIVDEESNVTMNNATMNNIIANNGQFSGNIEVQTINYKLSDSTNLSGTAFVFSSGEYTLPLIQTNMATEIKVFVYNPTRSATILNFTASGSDKIALQNGSVFSYVTTVGLSPNIFYTFISSQIGENGYWLIIQNSNLYGTDNS